MNCWSAFPPLSVTGLLGSHCTQSALQGTFNPLSYLRGLFLDISVAKILLLLCIQGCGIRRPDAVWHHPLGRKKYKYFLEQPTSVTGAGRDISFLCDAVVTRRKSEPLPPVTDKSGIGDTQNVCITESLIPEEYHIVKNKGLRSLELYEDAFTVQLQDDDQKLRVFPSLRPSGRLEVVQLMRMMDDMLVKAGVDQQSEELTELSQMEQLLELVQVEQNIYNIVFHELIRQVSVSCSERGQLLAKLRQRYQSLIERIPRHLKALHTEAVAQRALDRRLTEEIQHIKISMQQLSMELSKIREHDAFVSQQAELARRQLAGALDQTNTSADMVQGYHELYELQRCRLEGQLLQMTEERDNWSQLTFCLALKVISVKKLQLISQLHITEQSWSKTAEHCILYLSSKVTVQFLHLYFLCTAPGKHSLKQASIFLYHEDTLKWTFQASFIVNPLIVLMFGLCSYSMSNNMQCVSFVFLKSSLVSLKTLTLLCECYQGEKLLGCQQTLGELARVQESWLNMSLELFRRHPSLDGEAPEGQRTLRDLDKDLSEVLKQLDTQVSGETGIHGQIKSLQGSMGSWVSKLGGVIDRPELISISDWPKLENALRNWQSLAEEALKHFSSMQAEDKKETNKPDIFKATEDVLFKVQAFISNVSNFTDGENQRLSEEVTSIHMAQTRWMLDLLLLMVPDHSEDQNQVQEQHVTMNISLQTLDEDAEMLAERLDYFSKYMTSSCKLILEETIQQNPHEAGGENEMNEYTKLQVSNRGCMFHRCINFLFDQHNYTEELVVSPDTDDAQRAFSDLTTVGLLQQELRDSELRVQSAEQRALKAEEDLQTALERIQDLERKLQAQPSLEPKSKMKKTPPPKTPPSTPLSPPKKSTAEAKPSSSSKKTRKR
uniref:Axonemal dynein light chain domain containing 1 n=1 Tax=Labrus bergylta TaxID=56723 RepID=A0A3Q3GTL8_9LABR